jgi:hypothetical protein
MNTEGRAVTAQLRGGSSTGLGGRNLKMGDRGLAIDEVLVILAGEHGGLDVGSREPGLSIDNLVSAEVVTADGACCARARTRTPTCCGRSKAEAATSESSRRSSSRCIRSGRR